MASPLDQVQDTGFAQPTGSGNVSAVGGVTDHLAKFTGPDTITSSLITDDGTDIVVETLTGSVFIGADDPSVGTVTIQGEAGITLNAGVSNTVRIAGLYFYGEQTVADLMLIPNAGLRFRTSVA